MSLGECAWRCYLNTVTSVIPTSSKAQQLNSNAVDPFVDTNQALSASQGQQPGPGRKYKKVANADATASTICTTTNVSSVLSPAAAAKADTEADAEIKKRLTEIPPSAPLKVPSKRKTQK